MSSNIQGLSERRNENNGFLAVRMHYTLVPDFRSDEWKKNAKKGYSKDAWEQEMEINFTKAGTVQVYPDFDYEAHVRKLVPIKEKPLICGWDYGYHHPAFVICQVDTFDTLCVLDEYMGNDITVQNFTKQMIGILQNKYKYWYDKKSIRHFGDPAGNQQNDKSEYTSMQIQQHMGIFVGWRKVAKKQGIRILQLLMVGKDDTPRFKINNTCKILIDGFMGGYREQKAHEDKAPSEMPHDDSYYSHCQDALRYVVINTYPATGGTYRSMNTYTNTGEYDPLTDDEPDVPRQSRITGYY